MLLKLNSKEQMLKSVRVSKPPLLGLRHKENKHKEVDIKLSHKPRYEDPAAEYKEHETLTNHRAKPYMFANLSRAT